MKKENQIKQRLFAILLSFILVFSLLNGMVKAEIVRAEEGQQSTITINGVQSGQTYIENTKTLQYGVEKNYGEDTLYRYILKKNEEEGIVYDLGVGEQYRCGNFTITQKDGESIWYTLTFQVLLDHVVQEEKTICFRLGEIESTCTTFVTTQNSEEVNENTSVREKNKSTQNEEITQTIKQAQEDKKKEEQVTDTKKRKLQKTVQAGKEVQAKVQAEEVTEPVIVLTSLKNKVYYNDRVKLDLMINEPNVETTVATLYVTRALDGEKTETTQELTLTGEKTSFSFSYQEEGEYDVRVVVEELGQGKMEESRHFVIDSTKPKISIEGIENKAMSKEPVTLTFTIADRNHDTDTYRINIVRSDADAKEDRVEKYNAQDWLTEETTITKKITFDQEGKYEVVLQTVDQAKNEEEKKLIFYVDHTAPEVSDLTYSDPTGIIKEKYEHIFSNQTILVEFTVTDKVVGVDEENVYVTIGKQEEKGKNVYPAQKFGDDRYGVYIPTDVKAKEFKDKLTIWTADKLGNEYAVLSTNIVYQTDKPIIHMETIGKVKGWTNKNVTLQTTVTDEKAGIKAIQYKVNGKVVKSITFDRLVYRYEYAVTASENAADINGYEVVVEVTNNCGTMNTMKRHVYIDKDKPKVKLSGIEEGKHYNHNQTISATVEDLSYEKTTTTFQINRTLDGKTYTTTSKKFSSNQFQDVCRLNVTEEGLYKIYAISVDGAGNKTTSKPITFVVDKTAPKLSISGVNEGSMNGNAVTLDFQCDESFFETNEVSIQVEKELEGKTTSSEISGFPKNIKTASLSQNFAEDGTYKVTFSATDKAGNVAKVQTLTFSVDVTKPVIQIIGAENYEQFAKQTTLEFMVEEVYYEKSKVTISATRQDIDGEITNVDVPGFVQTGKVSRMSAEFTEDGIYEVSLNAQDGAGNQEVKQLRFTIDQKAPQIKGVGKYDGGYFKQFKLADHLEDMFKDLTVVSYRILLNGVEYNGTDEITEEGKYALNIEAKDEVGHRSEQSVEFIIDHTAPKILFSGVQDGETVHEKGTVKFELADDEDEIKAVRMNGKTYDTTVRELAYEEYGTYHIEIDCVDKAGNEETRSIYFVYRNWVQNVILFAGIGLAVLLAGAVFWFWKKRKKGN